jgi:acyl dehydratase
LKSLDIEKLRAFAIPEGEQELTAKDAAFYALSIGLGQDPLDLRQLDYVDPLRDLRIFPTMVLVIAHPGFWLADSRTGVDPACVLHREQSFEILRPVRIGARIRSRTRILDVIDKGSGRAALLNTETQLTQDGVEVATLRRTTFLRGAGGFGVDLPIRPEQALLYRLNGDLNSLHSDPRAAARAGFDKPILHGLCTMGIICNALLKNLAGYHERPLLSMHLEFSQPVLPGETLRTEIWNDGRFRARVLERNTLVADRGEIVFGPAYSATEERH